MDTRLPVAIITEKVMPTKPRKSRAPRIHLPEPIPTLEPDVLETINDWEDVDGDYLTELCRDGELLGVDE